MLHMQPSLMVLLANGWGVFQIFRLFWLLLKLSYKLVCYQANHHFVRLNVTICPHGSLGGLGIVDPSHYSVFQFSTSVAITAPLVQSILQHSSASSADVLHAQLEAK